MTDIPDYTAYLEFESGDEHCISYAETRKEDDTDYILIPGPIADLDYLNIKEGEVELYYDDDGFISLAASTGDGLSQLTIVEDEDGFWLEVPQEIDAIRPLNDTTHMPVLFLSCGELWILNKQDLWNKLAAEVKAE